MHGPEPPAGDQGPHAGARQGGGAHVRGPLGEGQAGQGGQGGEDRPGTARQEHGDAERPPEADGCHRGQAPGGETAQDRRWQIEGKDSGLGRIDPWSKKKLKILRRNFFRITGRAMDLT